MGVCVCGVRVFRSLEISKKKKEKEKEIQTQTPQKYLKTGRGGAISSIKVVSGSGHIIISYCICISCNILHNNNNNKGGVGVDDMLTPTG